MMLWLVVLLPIVAAGVALRLPRHVQLVAAGALGTTLGLGGWAAAIEATSVTSWGPRLELTLSATDFARVMVVLVPVIALPTVLYAAATERLARVRLVALLTAFVGAMELLVLANDLLTLLIGWELVGALSWILIAHHWGEPRNAQKASHAFITTRFGDLGLYVAAGIAFASTGSFAYSAVADSSPGHLQIVAGGILLAAAAKSAQVPFSPWLFSAMAGPTPVSALLHSSTMVAAGAYLLVRLAPQLDSVEWFGPAVVALGLTSAVAGGIVAALHRHPKSLLAASTTAQYGLMFVAIGAGSIVAAAAQLVTHAAFKSLLFLTAGTAMHAAGSDDLGALRLGRRLPVIAGFAAIGALALAALPPLGGAWSKEQIVGASVESSSLLGTAVLIAGTLSAFYALRYWVLAFGPGPRVTDAKHSPEGTAAIGLLAMLSIVLGILWLPSVNEAVADVVPGELVSAPPWELILGLASIAAAVGLVVLLDRRSRLVQALPWPALVGAATGWFGISTLARRVVVNPVLAISRFLAAFDDRVVDAGIRASARIAGSFSRLLSRRSEISIDSVVNGIGGGTLKMAAGARFADDNGVDRAAQGVALGFGRSGDLLRRLQTGLSHHYYMIVAVGIVALAAALAVGAS